MGRINPLIAIGLPTWGRVSVQWARAYRRLSGPLGSSMAELEPVTGKPIAEARNELMQSAIGINAEYLFMVGDDVLPGGDAITRLLARMQADPNLHLVTGVYWTKEWPTHPYLWQAMQRGNYEDWKLGEFFELDFAGCDCLLIRLSPEIKALGPDWFSTDWVWEPGQEVNKTMQTEDFYFYTKARKAGLKLWCDTEVQCLHEDRTNDVLFGLTSDMPQAGGIAPELPEAGIEERVVIADIGCGFDAPYFGEEEKVKVIRLDINPKAKPDYRCDVRKLPLADQSVDIARANHVLEHFGRGELLALITEWTRIIRVGGEIRLGVPNLLKAMEWIQAMEAGTTPPDRYPFWQLYGEQADQYDLHKNGFTPRRLELLLARLGIFEDIKVEETDGGINLLATAKKVRHAYPLSITEEWDQIAEQEGREIPGMKPKEKQDAGKS